MGTFTEFKNKLNNPDMPGVTDITPDEVLEKKDQICLIDVRRPDEFNGELGHIPGANMVVLDTLPDNMDQMPRDKTIVFVCRSGARSARAVAFAQEEGYEHVYNMQGGMLLWNQKKFETES